MKEIVWESIAGYNAATWPWQIALAAVAYFLAAVLFFRPCTWAKIAMKVFMVAVSLWIAFVYYMTFGSARDYSNIMTIFWCMMALTWIYDIATHFSSFQRSGRFTAAGIVILFLPLAYPLVSLARGMAFPEMATLLPSSVALFMLGMLMTFNRKINFFAFIFILHWSVIAISKIGAYDLPEDALLAAACIPSMAIFFIRSMNNITKECKPSIKAVKALILSVTLALTACMVLVLV